MKAAVVAAAAFAALFLVVAIVQHQSHKTEMLQEPDFAVRREEALKELTARREASPQLLLENAYAQGFRKGEEAADSQEHPPALIQAANKWRQMLLQKLRAQTEEEKTLDARKQEETARKVALAMRAAQASEPAALRAWEKLGVARNENEAALKVALAMRAEKMSEPAAAAKMQLAMRAEETSEPTAWHHWDAESEVAQKQALAMSAERSSEPQAYEKWESAEEARKRIAQSRIAKMHAVMNKDYETQLSELHEDREQAAKEAAKLFEFCSKQFPADQGLRKFCFEKLSSPPHAILSQSHEMPAAPEQFTAPTLQGAILKAEEHGEEGAPKYAVFHPADGPAEAFELVPVVPGGRVPADTEGFVSIPQGPSLAALRQERAAIDEQREMMMAEQQQQQQQLSAKGPEQIRINAPTLQDAIEEAHEMGLKGEPKFVVFHPADGAPEVFKLNSNSQRP